MSMGEGCLPTPLEFKALQRTPEGQIHHTLTKIYNSTEIAQFSARFHFKCTYSSVSRLIFH